MLSVATCLFHSPPHQALCFQFLGLGCGGMAERDFYNLLRFKISKILCHCKAACRILIFLAHPHPVLALLIMRLLQDCELQTRDRL